jgi:hypothetical protein
VTGETRRVAAEIAGRLARAAREVVRAVQAADAGQEGMLVHLLNAELDVEGVGAALRRVRRGVVLEGGCSPRHTARDLAGRFTKVHDPGAP